MNAAQLFAGEFYAWKRNPPKGRIPLDAVKVLLRHTEQRKKSYMQNRHTIAAITVVETGQEYSVPAREIISFWDDYEGERDVLMAERRKVEMRMRRQALQHQITESMMNHRFRERELPFVARVVGSDVILKLEPVLDYLDITEDQRNEAIDRVMEKEYGETGG